MISFFAFSISSLETRAQERAYAYFGDYLAPDPGCIREQEEPSTSFSFQHIPVSDYLIVHESSYQEILSSKHTSGQ